MYSRARSSASVESAAIDVWIFVVHATTTSLYNPQFDHIEHLCGSILPNDESEKNTKLDGNIYLIICFGEKEYLIF